MKLRLAIVGCGEIAGYVALLARFVPRLCLAACCDIDRERASRFAQRYRIPAVYQEYEALLDHELLDAVYLAVPHDLHLPLTVKAAEKGKAVLLEKPLARNTAEAQELIRQIGNNKVGVNYQYRYDRAAYALARAMQKGELGDINSIVIQVPWHRKSGYFEGSPWHRSLKRSGGGTLLTQASHFLDWAFWALKDKPQSAMGYIASIGFKVEVETLAHGIVQSQRGTLISIVSSMICPKEDSVTIRVDGQAGSAIYREKPMPALKFRGVKVKTERPPVRGFHALQRSLAAFVAWVLDDQPYLIPAPEALSALAAVEAIYRSAQTGKRENSIDE